LNRLMARAGGVERAEVGPVEAESDESAIRAFSTGECAVIGRFLLPHLRPHRR
jgi:hypothetical protein